MDRRSFVQLAALATAALGATPRSNTRPVIKPKRLAPGDTVGFVLPATAEMAADDVALARDQMEAIGFKVKVGAHAYDRWGYFAGKDADRAADINAMFA